MSQFHKNQVVWAKLQGHPWWPGFICDISNDKYEVIYFGDFSKSILKPSKIKPYSLEIPQKKGGIKLQKAIQMAERIILGVSDIEKEENLIRNNKQKIPFHSKKTPGVDLEETIENSSMYCEKMEEENSNSKKNFEMNQHKSNDMPLINQIKSNLDNLIADMKLRSDFTFKNSHIFFESLFDSIFSLKSIDLYNSNIGKKVKEMEAWALTNRSNKEILKLHFFLQNKLQILQQKVINNFFEIKNESNKTILTSTSNEFSPNQKSQSIDERIVFRVQKKIKKILYKNLEQKPSQLQLNILGRIIEERIQENSSNYQDYQEKTIQLITLLKDTLLTQKIITLYAEKATLQNLIDELLSNQFLLFQSQQMNSNTLQINPNLNNSCFVILYSQRLYVIKSNTLEIIFET